MTSLRVLHLRSSRGLAGPERHLLELLPGLAGQGIETEVAVLYRRQAGDPERHPLLDELAAVAIPGWQIADGDRFGRAAGAALGERLGRGDFAALHGHDPKSDWVIARAAHGSSLRRLATVHLHTRTTLALRLHRLVDLRLLRRCDGVIAVAEPLAAELARNLPESARRRLHVVPNGIDAEALGRRAAAGLPRARAELARWGGSPLLLAAGRLTRQKGFDLLIAAVREVAARHPGLVVAIAGDGPERSALARQAVRAGLSNSVRFLGERGDLSALLGAADGFVLSSRSEGAPYVVLEAMALGLPVVCSGTGGVAALLAGIGAGRLVAPGDPEALAAGIAWLCEHRAEARGEALRARDRVAARYSAVRMAEETAKVYREVLG